MKTIINPQPIITMQSQYKRLRSMVETFVGYKMQTRRHFDMLAETLFIHTRSMVSATTLRRFWGYQEQSGGVSINTLNMLARLIGYDDFQSFANASDESSRNSSEILAESHVVCADKLSIGMKLVVTWSPDRKLVLEYIGSETFRVQESQNSKLQKEDTFLCSQFVSGMPLFCNRLLRSGFPTMSYVCGKVGGIYVCVIE